MAIKQSTIPETIQRVNGDLQRSFPNASITDTSMLSILGKMLAGTSYELGELIQLLGKHGFPTNSTGINLEEWAVTQGISRLGGSKSVGTVVMTSTADSIFLAPGEELNTPSAVSYITQDAVQMEAFSLSVNLSLSGNIVTATFISPTQINLFAQNQTITISGVDQPEYNGDHIIIESYATYFKFQVQTTTPPTASGLIKADSIIGIVTVESKNIGDDKNLDSGAKLNFLSLPNPAINPDIYVSFDGITGGSSVETDDELRERVLSSFRQKPQQLSPADIDNISKQNKKVTRTSILRATPAPGQFTVYVATDNEISSIPDLGTLQNVKNRLVELAPIYISDLDQSTPEAGDIQVKPITTLAVDFTFTTITLATETMKSAIIANLKSFFLADTIIGENIKYEKILSVIKNTVDPVTGDALQTFEISLPTGDIVLADGEIAILGSVTFAV